MIQAINRNEVLVTFSKEVDGPIAETLGNYRYNNLPLDAGADRVSRQADRQSVIIFFNTELPHNHTASITVMNIKSADLLETAPTVTETVTFADLTLPTVTSVTPFGNARSFPPGLCPSRNSLKGPDPPEINPEIKLHNKEGN